jgi:hypothetical protein
LTHQYFCPLGFLLDSIKFEVTLLPLYLKKYHFIGGLPASLETINYSANHMYLIRQLFGASHSAVHSEGKLFSF